MIAKQAINDNLQGSVATYLRCGEVLITKLRKVYCWVWVNFFYIGEYFAKLQARTWLSRALCMPGQNTAERRRKCTRQSRFACNFVKYSPIKKFTHRLSSKPCLIWLLTTPPHLKYGTTLSCNLSLMACFADINVSRGSVAKHARCGGISKIRIITNLPGNLPV